MDSNLTDGLSFVESELSGYHKSSMPYGGFGKN